MTTFVYSQPLSIVSDITSTKETIWCQRCNCYVTSWIVHIEPSWLGSLIPCCGLSSDKIEYACNQCGHTIN